MKTTIRHLSFILLLIIISTSCKKDDNDPSISLIGSWIFSSQEFKDCTDISNNASYNEPCNSTDCITLTFLNDDSFQYEFLESGITTTESGTYLIDGDRITCAGYTNFWCESAGLVSFVITGTSLSITYSDDAPACSIVEQYEKK